MATCAACHSTGTLEYDASAGARVCTACGTVDSNSTSEALELLAPTLDAGGDEVGRTFIHGGDARRPDKQGEASMGTISREAYQERRIVATEMLMRSILQFFEMPSVNERAKFLFTTSRDVAKFQWGTKARAVAVACVYLAAREFKKDLRLVDLAAVTEISLSALSRAQRHVRGWVKAINAPDVELASFIESGLSHLKGLLSLPGPVVVPGGPKQKAWAPATRPWLLALNFDDVLKLAEGLLAFTLEVNVASGRVPQQVASGLLLVALEGVARTAAPKLSGILESLGAFFGIAASSSLDRYREIHRHLMAYAEHLPWLAARAAVLKKKDICANTADIVQHRIAIEKQDRKQNDALVELSNELGVEDPEDGRERSKSLSPSGSRLPGSPPSRAPSDSGRSNSATPPPGSLRTTSRLKRPHRLMQVDSGIAKRARTIEAAATSLLLPFSPSAPAMEAQPSRDAWLSQALPSISRADPTSRRLASPASLPAAPHDEHSVRIRRAFLAGVDPEEIYAAKPEAEFEDRTAPRRLHRLLWTKTEGEISDSELFDPGELDAYVRDERDVAVLADSEHFRTMPESSPGRIRPERKSKLKSKKRGKLADERNVKAEASLDSPVSLSSDYDGFVATRKSKIDDATRIRLMRLLADDAGVDEGVAQREALDLSLAMQVGDRVLGENVDGEDGEGGGLVDPLDAPDWW